MKKVIKTTQHLTLNNHRHQGTILLFVMIVLSLMTALTLGSIYRAQVDLKIANHFAKNTQAYYLALGGIERAIALLSQSELTEQQIAVIAAFNGSSQQEALFQFITDEVVSEHLLSYTIRDEQAMFNLNGRFANRFEHLVGREYAAQILDWTDQDNSPIGSEGAESDTYMRLPQPYQAANSAIYALRELTFLRDVSIHSYTGEDTNRNGLLDENERDDVASPPMDNANNTLDMGIADLFTAVGTDQININTAPAPILTAVGGLNDPPAVNLIMAHRNGPDGARGTEDDVYFTEAQDLVIEGLTETQQSLLQDTSRFCFDSSFFRIHVHAQVHKGFACNLMATVHCGDTNPNIIFMERLP